VDAKDCGIGVQGDRSPNSGSIEEDLGRQPHDGHEQGTCSTYHGAMPEWGEGAKPGPVTQGGADDADAAPLAIPRSPPPRTSH
jgi:hypothetical protein